MIRDQFITSPSWISERLRREARVQTLSEPSLESHTVRMGLFVFRCALVFVSFMETRPLPEESELTNVIPTQVMIVSFSNSCSHFFDGEFLETVMCHLKKFVVRPLHASSDYFEWRENLKYHADANRDGRGNVAKFIAEELPTDVSRGD